MHAGCIHYAVDERLPQWEEVRGVECGSETTGWSERERQAHMYAIIEFLSVFFYIYDKCIALTKLTHAHSLSQSL